MSYENLELNTTDGVCVITLNRPAKLNALNDALIGELHQAIGELRDDTSVGAVVLTGSGEKAFVAGADIGELVKNSPVDLAATSRRGQSCFDAIETLGKPVIAAINGFALGGGLELAMACTFRTASSKARMGLPEITLGIMPGYGGTQRLARQVGQGRAAEMMLTGEPVDAAEAHRIGLVNHVFEPDDLMPKTIALATKLAGRAPIAARFILDALVRGADMPLSDGQNLEASLFGLIASTDDTQEGLNAFLEKRKPTFKGS